jgi:hypothetical protein
VLKECVHPVLFVPSSGIVEKESVMTVDRALRLIAGAFVALSVLLGIYLNANFLWFTLFVGVNLFQSAFTNWCPMMVILRKAGLRDASQPRSSLTAAR